jgi:hypothetical protein
MALRTSHEITRRGLTRAAPDLGLRRGHDGTADLPCEGGIFASIRSATNGGRYPYRVLRERTPLGASEYTQTEGCRWTKTDGCIFGSCRLMGSKPACEVFHRSLGTAVKELGVTIETEFQEPIFLVLFGLRPEGDDL